MVLGKGIVEGQGRSRAQGACRHLVIDLGIDEAEGHDLGKARRNRSFACPVHQLPVGIPLPGGGAEDGQLRRYGVIAHMPDHLLVEVGNSLDVDPEGGHRHRDQIPLSLRREAEAAEYLERPLGGDFKAREGRERSNGELHPLPFPRLRVDIDAVLADPSARELGNQRRRPVAGHRRHFRIAAALEAVRGLRAHSQAACCSANREGVEVGALQEHVGGALVDLRVRAPHDSGQCNHAASVGDHQHRRIELALLAIERHQLFAGLGGTHNDPTPTNQIEIEGMEWLAELEQDVVGSIDHRVDRANAAVEEATLHPVRRGTHAH